MKIAFVNNRYQLGGAETVMNQLWLTGRQKGHAGEIYLGENLEKKLPAHVHFLYPAWLNRLWHSRLNRFVRRLAPHSRIRDQRLIALARQGHDLVHLHNFHGLYASTAALASLAHSVPLIWTFHRFWGVTGGCDHPGECLRYLDACGACPRLNEWPISGHDNTSAELAEKMRLLGAAPIVVVSPSRHLAEVVKRSRVGRSWRVEVIANGVNPDEFKPVPITARHNLRRSLGLDPHKQLVVIVNRSFADPLKGGDILAAAISRLDFSRTQVALVGGETKSLLHHLPPTADVVALGYITKRTSLASLLALAEVFLYASPRENFPCATLEAMSAGCCVVSTPTDGVLEQIEHRREGVFSADFSGAALAEAANNVLSSPERLAKMGRAARLRVMREFTEAAMAESYFALYAQVVADWRKQMQNRK